MSHDQTRTPSCRSLGDQREAPLGDAYRRALEAVTDSYVVPGHKRQARFGASVLGQDLALGGGIDDIHLSGGYLRRAERLAAELWGADDCLFSFAGSSLGNLTMLLACLPPGSKVIACRSLHKSVFGGLVLARAMPIWVAPDVDTATGLPVGVPRAAVRQAIAQHPDAVAVLLVEPSYIGTVSDVAGIAADTHSAGMLLLVDQAWGAHFGFHPALPQSGTQAGADVCIAGAHKTLPALTSSALILARSDRVDLDRLRRTYELVASTSPIGMALATMDDARAVMADRGEELLDQTIQFASDARRRLAQIDGLVVADDAWAERHPSLHAFDPTRLVLSINATGATGFAIDALLAEHGFRIELVDRDTLAPLITVGDDAARIDHLCTAIERALAHPGVRGAPRDPTPSTAWTAAPEIVMPPHEAHWAPSIRVNARDAIGRIAAETCAPYPPGIPAIAPGERITAATLQALRADARAGTRVAYCGDPTLDTVLVVDHS